jgi:hypothetical protein
MFSNGFLIVIAAPKQVPIIDCIASSTLLDDPQFQCQNAYDGSLSTDWAASSEGIGSWIKLTLRYSATLKQVRIAHRVLTDSEWNKNVLFEFSDGASILCRAEQSFVLVSCCLHVQARAR